MIIDALNRLNREAVEAQKLADDAARAGGDPSWQRLGDYDPLTIEGFAPIPKIMSKLVRGQEVTPDELSLWSKYKEELADPLNEAQRLRKQQIDIVEAVRYRKPAQLDIDLDAPAIPTAIDDITNEFADIDKQITRLHKERRDAGISASIDYAEAEGYGPVFQDIIPKIFRNESLTREELDLYTGYREVIRRSASADETNQIMQLRKRQVELVESARRKYRQEEFDYIAKTKKKPDDPEGLVEPDTRKVKDPRTGEMVLADTIVHPKTGKRVRVLWDEDRNYYRLDTDTYHDTAWDVLNGIPTRPVPRVRFNADAWASHIFKYLREHAWGAVDDYDVSSTGFARFFKGFGTGSHEVFYIDLSQQSNGSVRFPW